MEYTVIIEMITQVGFPIVCVIGLAWFVYKSQESITERNKEREDKYIEIYKEQCKNTERFSQALTKITETLKSMSKDIDDIKRKVEDDES